MDNKEFCVHLEEWKEETGKKEKDFAKILGIHPNTLVNWKKGKSEPQSEHMNLICKEFGILESDLTPLSFYTAKDNTNKLYCRTQQLQRYAKSKGLDDVFYRQITSRPYFLKEFPFSSTKDRFYQLRCPAYLAEDEKYRAALNSIPLTKYEFQDDYGKIIMITEKDIDFLITLQRKSEQLIRDAFYLELHRIEEQKNRKLVERISNWYLEDGKEIDPDKLYDSLTQTDFSERVITGSVIWERFKEYTETHNIELKPFKETMCDELDDYHPPITEEEKQAWREHYKAAGMSDEQIEEQFQRQEDIRQYFIKFEEDIYKSDDEGSGDSGQH